MGQSEWKEQQKLQATNIDQQGRIDVIDMRTFDLQKMVDIINKKYIDLNRWFDITFVNKFKRLMKDKKYEQQRNRLNKDALKLAETKLEKAWAILDYKRKQESEVIDWAKKRANELKKDYVSEYAKDSDYNRVVTNSVINAIKKWLLWKRVSYEFRSFLKDIDGYTPNPRKSKYLDEKWAKSGIYFLKEWNQMKEIFQLRDFMKNILWHDYDNIINWEDISDDKRKELIARFSKTEVLGDKKVEDFDRNRLNSLLWYIADFGWTNQWDAPDWILRTSNSRKHSWFLSRWFLAWEKAQSGPVSEVDFYDFLSKNIKSLDNLKNLITDAVYPWKSYWKREVDRIFASGSDSEIKELLDEFRNVWLWRVSELRDLAAAWYTNKEYNAEVINRAGNQLEKMQKFVERFSSSQDYKDKKRELMWEGISSNDAKSLLDNWIYSVLSYPEIYAWIDFVSTKNVNIDRTVDSLWKVLKESKTEKRSINWKPYLLLWINLASIKTRFWDTWRYTAEAWIGVNWIIWVDWIALPISIWTKLWATIIDENKWLSDQKLKWNWKIIVWGSVWKDVLKDWKVVPMVSLDINFNDKIDSIEKGIFNNKKILSNLIDKNWWLKASWIEQTKQVVQDLKNSLWEKATNKQKLYLEVLDINLAHLSSVMQQVWNDEEKKKIILSNWLRAVVSDFDTNIKAANSWINISWLHLWYIFWANLLNAGINLQHIQWYYDRSSEDQRKKDEEWQKNRLKEISVDLKDKIQTSPDWKTMKVNWVEVEIEWWDIEQTENPDWSYTLTSNKKINIVQKRQEWRLNHKIYTIVVSTEAQDININQGDIKEMNSKFRELWLNLPSSFMDRLYGWARSKWSNYSKLLNYVNRFLQDPNEWNLNFVKSKIYQFPVLFWFRTKAWKQNKQVIENMNVDQMIILASYMNKNTWWSRDIMTQKDKENKVSFWPKSLDLFKKVLKAEENLLRKEWLTDERAITDISIVKINAMSKMRAWNINFYHSKLLNSQSAKQYSDFMTLVSSTPKWWNHRLDILGSTDVEMYWDAHEITNIKSKEFILNRSSVLISKNLKKINADLNNLNIKWLNISEDEYKYMILNDWQLSTSLQAKLKGTNLNLEMSPSKFISFNAWYTWNECFNLWMNLLLWKMTLNKTPKRKNVATYEINTARWSMDSITLWFSLWLNQETHTTTKTQVKKEEPSSTPTTKPDESTPTKIWSDDATSTAHDNNATETTTWTNITSSENNVDTSSTWQGSDVNAANSGNTSWNAWRWS